MKRKFFFLILLVCLVATACQSASNSTTDEQEPPDSPVETATQVSHTPRPTSTETPPKPRPTINPESVIPLQAGTNLPIIRYFPEYGFKESESNRIGDSYPLNPRQPPCEFNYDIIGNYFKKVGFKWGRTSFEPLELGSAKAEGVFSNMEINPCNIEEITFLTENDITLMYVIVYWDEVLHADRYPNYQNEEEVEQYLDYTRMIVREFKGKIEYYEILNEGYFYVPVDVYIELIRRVIPVIREEDPDAKIVVGGATYLMNPGMQWYIDQVIQSDIISQVDGVNLHPMYGSSPQYEDTRQYYYDYPEMIRGIQETARANGFEGEFFAEEMCWRTSINPNPYEPWEFSSKQAAKYYARGIVINLGLDVWAGIGGEKYDQIRQVVTAVTSLSNLMVGAESDDFVVEVESESDEIVYYSFSYPNGDWLLAVWTDGIAVNDDPGVVANLTIDGISAEKAIGYDILYPFYQEIVFDTDANGLVIHDLVIRDYPTMILFTNSE